jgi:hypothetical protein
MSFITMGSQLNANHNPGASGGLSADSLARE